MVTPLNGSTAPVKFIRGTRLARRLRKGLIESEHRARLAYELQIGKLQIVDLTAKQARVLTDASAAGLAAERRKHRPSGNGNGKRRMLYRRAVTNVDIDAVVHELGIAKVMAALDRATAPHAVAAE
jgi:hypothetical protein